ncbi:MAG: hypothetical protein COA59_04920 [Colwellia sp.]|nr:MAG: hypothetical protein COA59_04920 [Colwellia sp.]
MRMFLLLLVLFSVSSYGEFSDNLRWSLDASVRLNKDIAANNTSRIYALGLDTHKIFSFASGDIGYAVGQLYFTKLSNQMPFSSLFNSPDDEQFVIREAHFNYTASPKWWPNIRIGHFTLPFGLEESIDTNGRLLDYYHGKNLGTKLDWGLGLNKVMSPIEYNISYTLGGKDQPKSIDGSYVFSGRIGSLSHYDFIIGLSFLAAKIDNIQRKRFAIDWQYYWQTWGFLGELALGKEDEFQQEWQKEKYCLLELNNTLINEQLKLYGQYIFNDREGEHQNHQLINIGVSYQMDAKLELSISSRKQLSTPESGKKQNLVRFQLRYRY